MSAPDFALYELLKAEWIAANPAATPAEYTAAIVNISKRCGV